MRHQPTPAEAELWKALRDRQLFTAKFRRQYALGRFIVDFYCSEKGVIVEVDGCSHEERQQEDAVRSEFLSSLGLKVLRFRNEQILDNLESVLEAIVWTFSERPTLRSPSTEPS